MVGWGRGREGHARGRPQSKDARRMRNCAKQHVHRKHHLNVPRPTRHNSTFPENMRRSARYLPSGLVALRGVRGGGAHVTPLTRRSLSCAGVVGQTGALQWGSLLVWRYRALAVARVTFPAREPRAAHILDAIRLHALRTLAVSLLDEVTAHASARSSLCVCVCEQRGQPSNKRCSTKAGKQGGRARRPCGPRTATNTKRTSTAIARVGARVGAALHWSFGRPTAVRRSVDHCSSSSSRFGVMV